MKEIKMSNFDTKPITTKGFAAAKPDTLSSLFRDAKATVARMDTLMGGLFDGKGGVGRRAVAVAYRFTVACIEQPTEAAKLQGWEDAKVPTGANEYGRPLKMLAGGKDDVTRSRNSIWAKVFRHAHAQGIAPDEFLEHVNRNNGMRRWYDAINAIDKLTAANDNHPDGCGTPSDGGVSPSDGASASAKQKSKRKPHVDITERVKQTKKIAFVIVDFDFLASNADAKSNLESNPAFLGIANVKDDSCRSFVQSNDSRFIPGKGVV